MSDIIGLNESIRGIEIIFKGLEMFFTFSGKTFSWSTDNLKKLGLVMYKSIKHHKDLIPGEIPYRSLAEKAEGRTNLMQIKLDLLEEFKAYTKKTGINYSVMPDINKKDDFIEIVYDEKHGEAFRLFIASHPESARTFSYEEYINNADEMDFQKEIEELINIKDDNKQEYNFNESINKFQENNIEEDYYKIISSGGERITVRPEQILNKNDKNSIMVTIPSNKDEFIEIPVNRFSKKDGVIYLAVKKDEDFKIYDKNYNFKNTINSKMLVNNNVLSQKPAIENLNNKDKAKVINFIYPQEKATKAVSVDKINDSIKKIAKKSKGR